MTRPSCMSSRRSWRSSSIPRWSPSPLAAAVGSRAAPHPALRGGSSAQRGWSVLHRQSDQPAAQRVTDHAQRGAQLVRIPEHVDARPVRQHSRTFVLITFVLLPYYLRQPSLERDIAQAEAGDPALAAELRLYREKLTGTQNARSEPSVPWRRRSSDWRPPRPWRQPNLP